MRRIPVGVIGAGTIGRMHVENLIHHVPEAYVKAVADTSLDESWAAALGIPVRARNVDAVLGNADIEIVVIAAPSTIHADLVKRAARAGKHIFCETPVGFEPNIIAETVTVTKRSGIKLHVGFNRRFDPHFQRVREAIADGQIGKLQLLKITNRDSRLPEMDYLSRSGGLFLDLTVHDFDMVRYLSGSEVDEVYVAGAVLIHPQVATIGDVDTALMTLRLESGALAMIDNCRETPYGYDQRIEALCSKGNIAAGNPQQTSVLLSTEAGESMDRLYDSYIERYRVSFIEELRSFFTSVKNDTSPSVSGDDALAAVVLARAAELSLRENRPVKLQELLEPSD